MHCSIIFLQHISGAGHRGGRQGSQLVAGDGGEGDALHFVLNFLLCLFLNSCFALYFVFNFFSH